MIQSFLHIYKSRKPISNFYLKDIYIFKEVFSCPGYPLSNENYISYNNFLTMSQKLWNILGLEATPWAYIVKIYKKNSIHSEPPKIAMLPKKMQFKTSGIKAT